MKRKNTTRNALLTSIISLLLCVSMLVGTTFAWFTDEVNSGINTIAAGNLDIELWYANPKTEEGTVITDYAELDWNPVDSGTELFNKDALWEPGYTEAVYLKIVNAGSLALKYNLTINVADELLGTSVLGNEIKLSDILMVNMEETFLEEGEVPTLFGSRDNATFDIGQWFGISLHKTIANKEGDTDVSLLSGEEVFVKLAVYMPTTTGNEANHVTGTQQPQIKMGLKLTATQLEYESDSFGTDYDEMAQYLPIVTSAADLANALENGQSVKLGNDIEIEETIIIPENAEVILNLNGKELSNGVGRDADNNRVHAIVNEGDLVLLEGTVSSTGENGGSAVVNNGTMTIDGATLNGAPQAGDAWPSYAVNNYGTMTISNSTITSNHGGVSNSAGATVTLNDVTVTVNGFGGSSHVFYNSGNLIVNSGSYTHMGDGDGTIISNSATATINGGTFVVNGGAYGPALSGGVLTINGGDLSDMTSFYNWGGSAVVNGGTYGFNPTQYVAEYYTATKNENGTYTVEPHDLVITISNKDELLAAFNSGVSTLSVAPTEPTYILTADIDMGGYNWTPAAKFTDTFDGQGHTISNLNINGTSSVGFFSEISGATVKNVNFDNITVTGNHWVGVLFGWEGAESLQSYVTNVNVTNSTVTVSTDETGDNGDKAGGIGGYAVTTTITDCSVKNTTITAYRDAAGILGYAHFGAVVENNSVANVTMVWDDSVNYKNYTDISEADLGVYVGEAVAEADIPVESADAVEIDEALSEGADEVILSNDLTVNANETKANSGYGATGVTVTSGSVLDGNGNTLTAENANGTWDCAIDADAGTIKNLTVNGAFRGIFMGSATGDVYIDNVIIDNVCYTFNSDGGNKDYGVYISNSTLNGWTSYSDVHKEVVFTNCNFGEGTGGYKYAFCRPYNASVFKGCVFEEGFEFDTSKTSDVVFENCYYGDTLITAENAATLGNGETTFFYNGLNGITIK